MVLQPSHAHVSIHHHAESWESFLYLTLTSVSKAAFVCVRVCVVHLQSVLSRGPGILDDSNSNQRCNAGQQENHHSCYATLVAHLSFRGHFLLAEGKKEKEKHFYPKSDDTENWEMMKTIFNWP